MKEKNVSTPASGPGGSTAAKRQEFTDAQLRQFLLDALNGRSVGADICWLIVNRWDTTRPKS